MATIPKVRESCDQCSHQKVKCGKQRPRCARCVGKGLACCNYSISMRIGRPPRPKEDGAFDSGAFEADFTSQSKFNVEWDNWETFMLLEDFSWDAAKDVLTAPTVPMSITGSPGELMTGMASASASHSSSSSLDQHFLPAPVVPAMAPQSTFPQSPPPLSTMDSIHVSGPGGRDCLGNIIKLLDDMHIRNPQCAGNDSTFPALERTIDQVLRHNRDCLSALGRVIDCPCLAQPSVLLSTYLLISTVISWYGAILGVGVSTTKDPAFTSMSRYIAPSPLYMGTYELSAEAKQSIRARVVTTELAAHVEPLLLRLPQFYASSSAGDPRLTGDGTSEPGSSDRTPLEVQKCILREQLQVLMMEAGRTT